MSSINLMRLIDPGEGKPLTLLFKMKHLKQVNDEGD